MAELPIIRAMRFFAIRESRGSRPCVGDDPGDSEVPDLVPRAFSNRDLALLLLIAVTPRLLGLGHVSMWLDEILGTIQSSRGLGAGLVALRDDAVHPPVWFLLDWLWARVSDAETWRRGLPALVGSFSVVLLGVLAHRWFGRTVAVLTALFASLAPYHVRYSQELRPYALTILLTVILLLLVDVAGGRAGRMPWLFVALTWAASISTSHFSVLLVLPLLLLAVNPHGAGGSFGTRTRRLVLALAGGAVLAAPSVALALAAAAKAHEEGASKWTWALAWRRWEFLTIAGREDSPGTAGSFVVMGVVLLGLLAAMRRQRGWVVIGGATAGTLGAELVLLRADHWSNGRYDIIGWPFIVILLALGCTALGGGLAAGLRRGGWHRTASLAGRWSRNVAAAGLVLLFGQGLWSYWSWGRPDWRAVAKAIDRLPPETPVFVSNDWTRVSLGHYLELERGAGAPGAQSLRVLGPDPWQELTGGGSRCAVVVEGGYPARGDLGALMGRTPAALRFPRTGATLAVLGLDGGEARGPLAWECAPPGFETDHEERRFSLAKLFAAGGGGGAASLAIEFDERSEECLGSGWSYAERTSEGMTFRWAVGEWASVRVPGTRSRSLALTVWPYSPPREMTVYRNREALATIELDEGRLETRIQLPARPAPAVTDVFHFQFSRNAEQLAHPRLLAVGFDRLELAQ